MRNETIAIRGGCQVDRSRPVAVPCASRLSVKSRS
jgi:hypothetical protein